MTRKILFTIISLLCCNVSIFAQYDEIIKEIKQKYCPDKRVAIWDIKAEVSKNVATLTGKTDNIEAKVVLLGELSNKGLKYKDNIKVLPDENLKNHWGFTIIPYAHIRTNPGHESELTTQSLMGNPMKILEEKDGWYRVQTPDNYIAWVINNSIKTVSDEEFEQWKTSERYITTAIYTYLYETAECAEIVSDLVLGNILIGEKINDKVVSLLTPDGRKGYAKIEDVQELTEWANQEFNVDKIVNTAKMLMGSTYTWGGTSTKGVDCSGLTKTSYFSNAIILQRDASQQVKYGKIIDPENWGMARKGDLLYFGTKSGKVTHTAIYMEDGKYIHASGRVKINSVDPQSSSYLTTPFLSINRIEGNVDKPGIQSVKNHKWYFTK